MNIHSYTLSYLEDVKGLLDKLDSSKVEAAVDLLLEAWRHGRRVLLMGNGGSSSSVSHIVNDMQKNILLESGRGLRAMCLSDCTPLMMAWANDTAWDNVFAPQVECWAEPGDVVIGVSGSGNSMNVINGMETANGRGAHTVGLVGFDGGKLLAVAQTCLLVESRNMQRIEDVHMILLHIIFSALLEQTKLEKGRAMSRAAVFLDRDGVINVETGKHIVRAEDLVLLPGSVEAIASLSSAGWPVVVYTNQSGVGRGLMTEDDLESIHAVIDREVGAHGGELTAIYSCMHHPDEACACRKPQPGMLLQAALEHDLDLAVSYAIGDSPRDIAAAHAAGCVPVLVLSGSTRAYVPDMFPSAHPRHVFPDLAAFTRWLLGQG